MKLKIKAAFAAMSKIRSKKATEVHFDGSVCHSVAAHHHVVFTANKKVTDTPFSLLRKAEQVARIVEHGAAVDGDRANSAGMQYQTITPEYVTEIPKLPDSSREGIFVVTVARKALETAAKFVDLLRDSPVLSGVAVYPDGSLCATDGKALYATAVSDAKLRPAIVHISQVRILLASGAPEIEFRCESSSRYAADAYFLIHGIVRGDNGELRTVRHGISGTYPAWQSLVQDRKQKITRSLRVPVELLKQVRKSIPARGPRAFFLVLRGGFWGATSLSSTHSPVFAFRREVIEEAGQPEWWGCFNIRYFTNLIKGLKGDYVTLLWTDKTRAAFLEAADIRLIMPVTPPENRTPPSLDDAADV